MKLFAVLSVVSYFALTKSVTIESNGYRGVIISFSEKVLQQAVDFEKLKNVLQNASEYLYSVTRRRAFFEEFVLVVPSAWTTNEVCQEFIVEMPKSIDIYFTHSSESDSLRSQHSRGCGKKGEIIYIPHLWLRGDTEILARQIVQLWSTFRYGVFSETPERSNDCFAHKDGSWSPAGCYNVKLNESFEMDGNGLPVCNFSDDFLQKHLKSSIMFTAKSSKVSDYCDGSDDFPHNPVEPTLHNRLCEGRDVWTVIKSTEDFFGSNRPLKEDKPPKSPAFSCYKETMIEVVFAIQNGYTKDLSQVLIEMRYSLYRFLSNMMPVDSTVHLLTFAGASVADAVQYVQLNLKNTKQLYSALDKYLRYRGKFEDVCVACGLEQALKVPGLHHPVIVLVAWESSLTNEKASELKTLLEASPNAVLHLMLLEDSVGYSETPELLKVVWSKLGKVFKLKTDLVLMNMQFNVALVEAVRNPLHIEDKTTVVHQTIYENVTSNLIDSFVIPSGTKGQLLYMMQCENLDDMKNTDGSCEDWKNNSYTFKCGKEYTLSDDVAKEFWSYSYENQGFSPITCASLAILLSASPAVNSLAVRGWLSKNEISSGSSALIVYAEILSKEKYQVQVEALIFGPGLEIPFRLQLRDNGNGDPDMIKGDGIFSRYFTSYRKKGTYTVTLNVDISSLQKYGEVNSEKTKQKQTKPIGFFTILQDLPEEDMSPPNRVADLRVISVNHANSTVILQWTAPGGNFDSGRATKYEVRFASHWSNLLEISFKQESYLKLSSKILPAESGITENVQAELPQKDYNRTYYVALRAMNKYQYSSGVSNIVQIFFQGQSKITSTTETKSSDIPNTSASFNTETNIPFTGSTENNNTTVTTSNENENVTVTTHSNWTPEDCIEKSYIIMLVSSVGGGILILIIIVNIIVCCCCFRKRKNSHLARSQSRYGIDNNGNDSFDTDRQFSFSSPYQQNRSESYDYTYHTNKSLNKENNRNIDKELGFRLVQTMPRFANNSPSLTSESVDQDTEIKNRMSQPKNIRNRDETEVYNLGKV